MYPKILIISETFKSKSGGGITLSNLFRGYPKDLLANAIDAVFVPDIESDEICSNFYSLGNEERKILPIFSFLHSAYPSGKYEFKVNTEKKESVLKKNKIKNTLKKIVNPVFDFLGINHILFHYKISNRLKVWIKEFKPDIIYSQLSNIEIMNFTLALKEFTGAKLVIHIMDDWPSTIGNRQLTGYYWKSQADKLFKKIINQTDLLLSISEGMSVEYQKRYGKEFIPFHNPIETETWKKFSKKDYQIDKENIKILYAGRIGTGISDSLLSCAKAIERLKCAGNNINLIVQTTSVNSTTLIKLKKFNCVVVNPVVKYSELPQIFSNADILLMPVDFSKKGINFLRYSMPTKASEFMISGTPIMLFCDPKVSLSQHALKYGWAYHVEHNDSIILSEAIKYLIDNENIRIGIAQTAVKFAEHHFDANRVSVNFKNLFVQLMN